MFKLLNCSYEYSKSWWSLFFSTFNSLGTDVEIDQQPDLKTTKFGNVQMQFTEVPEKYTNWCKENCRGNYHLFVNPSMNISCKFENKDDATLFKLTWG